VSNEQALELRLQRAEHKVRILEHLIEERLGIADRPVAGECA